VKRDTVRLALAPVKALLATAAEDGLIRGNPAHGLRNLVPADLAREDEQLKALTEDELRAFLAQLPVAWTPFFEFLTQTGLRIGEAIEVRIGDLDFGKRRLHVQRRFYRGRVDLPKGRKRRRVPLSETLARALWVRVSSTSANDEDLLFTAEKGGRIDQSNLMSRVLKPAARDASVGEWVGFHTFRHTCATMLFRRGWNAVQVQRFMGHSDPGFTLRRYVHLLDDDLPEPEFGIDGGLEPAVVLAESLRTEVAR
jgi:integrase